MRRRQVLLMVVMVDRCMGVKGRGWGPWKITERRRILLRGTLTGWEWRIEWRRQRLTRLERRRMKAIGVSTVNISDRIVRSAGSWCCGIYRRGLNRFSANCNCWSTASAVRAAIPPVLYRVIWAAVQMSGNLSPTLAVLCHKLLNVNTLLIGDGAVIEGRF